MEVIIEKLKTLVLTLSVLFFCTPAEAQFYVSGQSETSLRWSYVLTDNYRIIYPEGLDSLARAYAVSLESVRPAVGTSVGQLSNEQYRRRMPVILLTQEPDANGMVVWTPRRMELQTVPDAYSPEAMAWIPQLTIHETRHSSQMQFSNRGKWRFYHFFTGEAFSGILSGLYTSSLFLEGDAVVAETGLSKAGRGRSAEFLEYYRAAWSKGDNRDWYKWRFGSFRQYTPNKYAQGYVAYAGTRYRTSNGYVTKAYFDDLHYSIAPFPLDSEFKKIGGEGKKIKPAFRDVSDEFLRMWEKNDSLRGGVFMEAEALVPAGKFYSTFTGTVAAEDCLYAIRRGKDAAASLVRIDSTGTVTKLSQWGGSTSKLDYSDGRLYWSESVYDARWEMKGTSRIRTMSVDGEDVRDITTEGMYYNPAVRNGVIAAARYRSDAGTEIVLLSAEDGSELRCISAPSELQVMEPVWVGEELYTSAVTGNGYGIYRVQDNGSFTEVLQPQPVRAVNLRAACDEILFTSDRTTVNELYSLNVTGNVRQMTQTKFGASDFATDGKYLYFSETDIAGKPLKKCPLDSLPIINAVDYSELMGNEIADNLSAQEEEMGAEFRDPSTISVSAPKHYSKALHALKIHSWAPLYINYDEIEEMSFSTTSIPANLGATVFFQNDLSTLYGGAGVSVMNSTWDAVEPQGHIYLTYAGLMPKFKFEFNYGGEHRKRYSLCEITRSESTSELFVGNSLSGQSFNASLTAYLPLAISKGGWNKGFIPQLSYSISNNYFDQAVYKYKGSGEGPSDPLFTMFVGNTDGRPIAVQRISASARAYYIQPKPASALFPQLGIGGQAGFLLRPGLTDKMSSTAYALVYGYVPGFLPLHAMKLTLTGLKQFNAPISESSSLALPTGFTSSDALVLNTLYPNQISGKIEYAFPFADLQWSFLEPVTYVKNLNLSLRAEGTIMAGKQLGAAAFYNVGADLDASVGNLLMVRADMRIGLSWSYIGGSAWSSIVTDTDHLSHHYFAPVFKLDF